MSSSLCVFLQHPINPPRPLLNPSAFLTNLFSNILSQGYTNLGNQDARATKFFIVAPRALLSQYGTCFVTLLVWRILR